MKHTELPWKIEYDNADERGGGQWYNIGPTTVWFPYGAPQEEKDRAVANAAFIVRACNSHYELLEACKKVLEISHDPAVERILIETIRKMVLL